MSNKRSDPKIMNNLKQTEEKKDKTSRNGSQRIQKRK